MDISEFSKYIGARVKKRRKELGISMLQFADILQLSYQQVQKYEAGTSKLTAEKMALIAHVFNVPVDYFYKDIDLNAITIGSELEPTVVSAVRQNKLRAMLVEDKSDEVLVIQQLIGASEFIDQLALENHADEVIPYLHNHHRNPYHVLPDIILLDINMPGGEGMELLRDIKEDPKLRHIIVIIVSTNANWKDLMRAYSLGAASYILKTNDLEDFEKRFTQAMAYWSHCTVLPHM